MYYKGLANEYFKEAEMLKGYIRSLKKKYIGEITPENSEIYYRVSMLYTMYLELKHTGEYLMRKCEVMKDEE